jgi:hypothetical protein
MAEGTTFEWTQLIITCAGGLIVFGVGLYQYVTTSSQAARQPFLKKQMELCIQACDAPPVRLAGDRPGGAGEPRPARCAAPRTRAVGKTPVLEPEEARALIDSIDVTTPAGLRDRALIALMVFSFARIGAALGMKVEDVFTQNRRLWVRLREKGGKPHAMPCHHNLETYLTAYIDGAGLAGDPKGPLFRTIGARHRAADAHAPAPGERLCDDPPARGGGRHRDQARQSQLPGDRDHGVSQERRHAGEGGADGEPCQHAHDAALRSPARGTQPR